MAFKLTALSALVAPASASWVVQSLPDFRDYFSPMLPSTSPFAIYGLGARHSPMLPSTNPFAVYGLGARHSPMLPSTNPFAVYELGARDLYSSPFSARSLFRQRQFSFSRQLDGLADALDDLKTTSMWKEHDDHVEARLLVRGLRAEQLKAEVSDTGVLTVSGERSCDGACKSASTYSLSLPFDVTDTSKLSLALDGGVLTVKVPKALRAPPMAKTSLQIVAAESSEEKKKPEALPTPTPPKAVEEETLRALEKKFPQASDALEASASESGVKEASDSDAVAPAAAAEPVAEQRDAIDTLRKVIHTAIGATSMAAAGKQESPPAETVAPA